MNREQQALQYAQSISDNSFVNILKEAYLKGYEDGVASTSIPKDSEILSDEDIVWSDLNLPSRNLWGHRKTNNINREYPTDDSLLPTKEDFDELFSCSMHFDFSYYDSWMNAIGIQMSKSWFSLCSFWGRGFDADFSINIWVKSNKTTDSKRETIQIDYNYSREVKTEDRVSIKGIVEHFEENKNIVLYCKKRN